MRYLQPMMLNDRVVHERLARLCHCDYDREIPLVVEPREGDDGRSILGVGRLSKLHGADEARLTILIADPYQGMGIGRQLVSRIVDVAKGERLRRLAATLTPDNLVMRHIFDELGFSLELTGDGKLLIASKELGEG